MNDDVSRRIRINSQALDVLECCVITPLGATVAHNLAALNAGVATHKPSRITNPLEQPYITCAVPDEQLPPLHAQVAQRIVSPRQERIVRLAAAACRTAKTKNVPLLLCLPKLTPWLPDDNFAASILPWLEQQTDGLFDTAHSRVFELGSASAIGALQAAVSYLQQAGHASVWVAAVDTLCDRDELDALDSNGMLCTSQRPRGIVAGEAAIFMRVGLAKAGAPGVQILATGLARDPGVDSANAAMVEQLMALLGNSERRCELIYPDLNGASLPMNIWLQIAQRMGARLSAAQQLVIPSYFGGYAGVAHALWLVALAAQQAPNDKRLALVSIGADTSLAGCALLGAALSSSH